MPPSPVRPPSLQGFPSYLAAQVAKHASRVLGEALAAHGVRPHHLAVLATLSDFGPQCQQDLCDRLDLDKSHMVAFVDDLEGMGHVSRARDTEDRRRHRVELTASGEALLGELMATEVACQEQVFGVLDAADRAQLVALLQAVVVHADRERLGADPRVARAACQPAGASVGAGAL